MNETAEQYPDPTSIRQGVERAVKALRGGGVTTGLLIWEGHEDVIQLAADARHRHGEAALEQLGAVIDDLGDLRIALRAALLAPADDDEADDDAPIVVQSDSVYLDPAVRAAVHAECSAPGYETEA